MAQVQMFIHN